MNTQHIAKILLAETASYESDPFPKARLETLQKFQKCGIPGSYILNHRSYYCENYNCNNQFDAYFHRPSDGSDWL